MSETPAKAVGEESPTKAVGGAWTAAEKVALLMKIIHQLTDGGHATIKWDTINLPGRTPKALMHVWTKLRAEGVELPDETARTPVTPKARGRGPAKNKAAEGLETPTPKKRGRPSKAMKSEAVVNDGDDEDSHPVRDEDIKLDTSGGPHLAKGELKNELATT